MISEEKWFEGDIGGCPCLPISCYAGEDEGCGGEVNGDKSAQNGGTEG